MRVQSIRQGHFYVFYFRFLLPIFSKIIQKAAHSQLSAFLERNESLTEFQFGHREKRSTKLASRFLFDNIRSAIDNGNLVRATVIDLTKAFDTVSHKHTSWEVNWVWDKRYKKGVDDKLPFKSEASSQHQWSLLWPRLLHGLPQGSILGPLLFLIYFNDFTECLKKMQLYYVRGRYSNLRGW